MMSNVACVIAGMVVLMCSTAVSEERLVITPNEFEGSDGERINQAIAAAEGTGKRVVIPKLNRGGDGPPRDVWLLDSAILVRNGTTLVLENCHVKLSDRCRDNFVRSANCGVGITDIEPMSDIHILGVGSVLLEGADRPRATGDSAKTLGERTYGTDAGVAGESQTGDWRNIGILLAFVERFSIENIRMKDSHCWGVSLERCAFGRVRDLEFASTQRKMIDGKSATILNQDGLDLRQGCHDITIENITGHSGDDLVALTNILGTDRAGSTESTMVSAATNRGDGQDDIRNIVLRNVRGHCAGGHHIVRFLNAGGLKIHDVMLDGLIDTSGSGKPCKAALKIGDSNPTWGGVTPLGDTYRVLISNIMSRARHTILIAGSLSESSITNVIKYDAPGEPITYESGKEHVRNVAITNARAVNGAAESSSGVNPGRDEGAEPSPEAEKLRARGQEYTLFVKETSHESHWIYQNETAKLDEALRAIVLNALQELGSFEDLMRRFDDVVQWQEMSSQQAVGSLHSGHMAPVPGMENDVLTEFPEHPLPIVLYRHAETEADADLVLLMNAFITKEQGQFFRIRTPPYAIASWNGQAHLSDLTQQFSYPGSEPWAGGHDVTIVDTFSSEERFPYVGLVDGPSGNAGGLTLSVVRYDEAANRWAGFWGAERSGISGWRYDPEAKALQMKWHTGEESGVEELDMHVLLEEGRAHEESLQVRH